MDVEIATTIFRNACFTVLLTAAPMLLSALVVGVTIALLQSITSIQEMTLTFIPKIIMIFVSAMIFFPWMIRVIASFTISLITNLPAYVEH